MKVIFSSSTIAITVVLLLVTGIGATVFITPAYAPQPAKLLPQPAPLTGIWRGDDAGTYYLRQIDATRDIGYHGDVVWWVGLSGGNDGRTYSNIFRGTITTLPGYGLVIDGEFVDVPRGVIQNSGKLLLDINEGGTEYIKKISGAFGTTTWARVDRMVGTTTWTFF